MDWTVRELREFLEMLEADGDGDNIIRFEYDEKTYQLDWPICYSEDRVKIGEIGEEIPEYQGMPQYRDSIDFCLVRDYRNLKKRCERPSIIKEK